MKAPKADAVQRLAPAGHLGLVRIACSDDHDVTRTRLEHSGLGARERLLGDVRIPGILLRAAGRTPGPLPDRRLAARIRLVDRGVRRQAGRDPSDDVVRGELRRGTDMDVGPTAQDADDAGQVFTEARLPSDRHRTTGRRSDPADERRGGPGSRPVRRPENAPPAMGRETEAAGRPGSPRGRSRARSILPDPARMGDTRTMSCRHQPDVTRTGPLEEAPSSCRKWRRWPRELPGSANDNGRRATVRALGLGTAVLGLIAVTSLLFTLTS